MREAAGASVRHSIVAEKGVNAVVCTSSIVGGGPTGAAGVVVVSVGVDVVGGCVASVGSARNLRSAEYGELKETSGAPALGTALALRECDCAATADSGRRPGVSGAPVSSPTARTGRPPGGAKLRREAGAAAAAAGAATGVESDPGRASLKPIVVPATTASESHSAVRRGTI